MLNAAAGIYVAGLVASYDEGVRVAARVLEEGKAGFVLAQLRGAGRADG